MHLHPQPPTKDPGVPLALLYQMSTPPAQSNLSSPLQVSSSLDHPLSEPHRSPSPESTTPLTSPVQRNRVFWLHSEDLTRVRTLLKNSTGILGAAMQQLSRMEYLTVPV